MPVPTETLWNLKKANLWFALSGLALMGSTLWMLWDDYDRDWRTYQRDYFRLQAVMAEMDWLETQTPEARKEFEEANQRRREAQESVDRRQEEIAGIRAKLEPLHAHIAVTAAIHNVHRRRGGRRRDHGETLDLRQPGRRAHRSKPPGPYR